MLTPAAVRAIRRDHAAAVKAGRRPRMKSYAERYGLSTAAVSHISTYLTYRWVHDA